MSLFSLFSRSAERPAAAAGRGITRSTPSDPEPRAERAHEIFERMAEGILVLDAELRPQFANRAARQLLGIRPGKLPARLPAPEVGNVARAAREESEKGEDLVEIWYPRRLTLRIQATHLEGAGEDVLIVLQDVTEEVRTQRIRREFVAHASHELKSPVASLQTLAEAVAQAAGEDPEAAIRFSSRLVDEADRLGKLIGDLLDLSRLDEPAEVPNELCNLSELARKELAQAELPAFEHGLRLESFIASNVFVRGDAQQLALVIRNLLENAIRYTGTDGSIELRIQALGEYAVIQVSDDGVGIPLEAQGRIFERFYRVDRARSRDRGGTGLGLAIVKNAAERHGGTVEVESEIGRGSTFTVRFPLSRDRHEEDPPAPPMKASA